MNVGTVVSRVTWRVRAALHVLRGRPTIAFCDVVDEVRVSPGEHTVRYPILVVGSRIDGVKAT